MQGKGLDDGDTWVSITDLMTGLMATFLLIALAFMLQLQQKDPLEAHRLIEQNIFNALKTEFQQEEAAQMITVDSSLTMRFIDGKVKMFTQGQKSLEPEFKLMLNTTLPKYLELITRDTVLKHIAEVRIEGHANSDQNADYTALHWNDASVAHLDAAERKQYLSYAFNSELSQSRSREVLAYVRTHQSYLGLPPEKRERLDFLLSATGMSFARRLDDSGELAYITEKPENKATSLRVEFKIVTSRPGGLDDTLEDKASRP